MRGEFINHKLNSEDQKRAGPSPAPAAPTASSLGLDELRLQLVDATAEHRSLTTSTPHLWCSRPPGPAAVASQCITNPGTADLISLCVCTPGYRTDTCRCDDQPGTPKEQRLFERS
jgi:hypothetical protein